MKTTITEYLQSVLESNSIEKDVINCVLARVESDQLAYLKDICEHGCASGMIPHLIYYCDTHRYFEEHYPEIEYLRQEQEINVPFGTDLKNYLSWVAFENAAYQLLRKYENISDNN